MDGFSCVVIDWTGKRLTGEQMLVVQNAALDFESTDGSERILFNHPLCEGVISCKGRMMFGLFIGTRYVAFLDSENDTPRKFEFLLTDHYRRAKLATKQPVTEIEMDETGRVISAIPVDVKRARSVKTRRTRAS